MVAGAGPGDCGRSVLISILGMLRRRQSLRQVWVCADDAMMRRVEEDVKMAYWILALDGECARAWASSRRCIEPLDADAPARSGEALLTAGEEPMSGGRPCAASGEGSMGLKTERGAEERACSAGAEGECEEMWSGVLWTASVALIVLEQAGIATRPGVVVVGVAAASAAYVPEDRVCRDSRSALDRAVGAWQESARQNGEE